MQWYYLDEQRQQMETDEEGLRRLAESGDLPPGTLVWNDSMTEWTPLKRALSGAPATRALTDETGIQINPYQVPLSNRGGGNVRALAAILAQHAGWTRFLGVVTIVGGALSLPIGLFYIWMGIILFQIASQAEEAKQSGSERALTEVMEKTALYFKANAIFILVAIILGILIAGVILSAAVFFGFREAGSFRLP